MQSRSDRENDVSGDALEDWLKILITDKKFPAAALAEAMIDDGFTAGEAHVLAAAAYIRYSATPLSDLAQSEAGRGVLEALAQYARAAIFDSCPHSVEQQPLNPGHLHRNRIALHDRTVSLRFVAENPRVAVFGNLLSDEECGSLIEVAKARLQPDMVVDKISGADLTDIDTRSSYGTFLRHDEFEWLIPITQRIAELVRWPVARLEDIAISHYREGQQFLPHYDYFDTAGENIEALLHAGQRIATLVIYLNDVEGGGGTLFPQAGYEIIPQRGSGTYFTYQRPDGSLDSTSIHGGNCVSAGEKWIATLWFVERNIERYKQQDG